MLDTNALIAAIEHGRAGILAGRAPVVSITAAREFLEGGSVVQLREFMIANGGRIGVAGTDAAVAALQRQASKMGRVLHTLDGRVAAGAMAERLTLMTADGDLTKFLKAISHPVEGF
jgi:predicted nucleic acid-binding protein